MPRVSWFYGIGIYLYYADHPPPHFEAMYGDFLANVLIETGEVIDGRLPPNARKLVRRWTLRHRVALRANWARARADLPLEPIPGLDDD
jgi:hypothetical protein